MSSEESHVWRESVAPHELPSMRRSLVDLATSVVPYLALTVADVPLPRRLGLAHPRAGGPGGRLPAADLHRLPRLHPRLVHADQAGEQVGRAVRRPARLPAVRELAPQPRRPPRHRRRPRPPRHRRRDDAHRRGVRVARLERAARVPAFPQPAGDVRDRADLVADDRSADLVLASSASASATASC